MRSFFGIDETLILQEWPRVSMLVTIFYTIAHILPANLIRCYIFRSYLRYSLARILGGLGLLLAIETCFQLMYPRIYSTRIGFVFYFIYFFYFCAMTRVAFCKQITIVLPLGLVLLVLQNLAYTIEYHWPLFPIPFIESGILVPLGLGIFLPAFRKYKEKVAAPLLADTSLTELWPPLAAMAFATLLLSILTSPFHEIRSLTAFLARFAASMGALAGISIALYAAKQVIQRRQLNSILAVTQEMRELEQKHYANIAKIEESTTTIQKELIGYAEHIAQLLEARDYDGIRAYSRSFLEGQQTLSARRLCNNELVNAIVNYWQDQLSQLQVKSDFNLILGKEDPIDPLHMTAILGNLMRNAAEALSRIDVPEDRFLKLSLMELGGLLIITVDNSFNGELQQDADAQYLSAKRGFASRGIGLDSIRYSVSQYHGTFETKIRGKLFEASVMLPLIAKE